MKNLLSLLFSVLFSHVLIGQNIISIDSARTIPVGDSLTITGIITNGAELGTIRYIQDGTAGIGIYDWDVNYFQRGDSVTVSGVMDEYNMLLEIANLYYDTVYSSGHTLPVPVVLAANNIGETFEGQLIRINDATFNNPGGLFSGNNNYMMTAPDGQFEIRVNTSSSLVGKNIPVGTVDIIGILSQYSYSNPNAGYQVLLRDSADIISNASITITTPIEISNITQTGFDLSWETDSLGTTEIFYGNTPSLGQHLFNYTNTTNHTLPITGASPAELFYVKAFSVKGSDTSFSAVSSFITQSASSGDIKVYFTSSVDHTVSSGINAIQLDNLLDDTLIAYINRAVQTIDFAIYNFNITDISNIVTALNNAHNRGVRVRVVHDGSSSNIAITGLDTAIGIITSPTTSEYGIMHNKFMIADVDHTNPDIPVVWTGSMNWTKQGINQYANNVIILQDQSLAKAYTIEFEEMFGSSGPKPNAAVSRFSLYKFNNTPHEFIIGGKRVECYFSPSDGVNQKIINTINEANEEVFVNTMLITRSDIGYALRDQYNTGKDVNVLVNHKNDCSSTVVATLEGSLDSNFRAFAEPYILHHKLMITDPNYPGLNPKVLTGCHNWSNSAEQKNDENTLIIHDSTIANIYYQEFSQRWKLTEPGAGINTGSKNYPFLLYPNPSSGNINIAFHNNRDTDGLIALYDIKGEEVWHTNITITAGMNNIQLSPGQPGGFYVLKAIIENRSFVEKVIINQ